jgi:hypothetical protein
MDYAPLGIGSRSAAFEYAPAARLGELGEAGQGKVAYCPREACLASASSGGGLEYVSATGALYYARDGHLRTIIGSEGERASIDGMGEENPDGSWTGLPLTWNRTVWAVDPMRVREFMDALSVARFSIGKVQQSGWSVTGDIRHDSTPLEDKDGQFVRIRALETRPDGWLAVVYAGPQFMPEANFSLECELRSQVKQVVLQSFDFGPNGVIGMHSLPVSGAQGWVQAILNYRFRTAATGTYMAAGIFGVKNGEFVDIRSARIVKGRWFEGVQAKE